MPHGDWDRAPGSDARVRKVPRSLWGDSPVQAGDWRSGGRRPLNSAQTKRTIFTVQSGAPPLGPPTPDGGELDIDPKKKQTNNNLKPARPQVNAREQLLRSGG